MTDDAVSVASGGTGSNKGEGEDKEPSLEKVPSVESDPMSPVPGKNACSPLMV